MNKTKLLAILFIILFTVSISATFYDSVIRENLHTRGALISTEENNEAVTFYYKNIEYTVEVDSLNFEAVIADVALALQMNVMDLPEDLTVDIYEAVSATTL